MRDALEKASAYFPGLDGGTLYTRPRQVVTAHRLEEVAPALDVVRRAVEDGKHAAGFVAYEAAPAFDTALAAHAPGPLPLLWFGLYDAPTPCAMPETNPGAPALTCREGIEAAAYHEAFAMIQAEIAAGNTYQVNYTWPLHGAFDGDGQALFQMLHARQPTPYGAFIHLGRHQIISVSPELFFRLDGHRIETEPMKGTAPRGRYPEEDARMRAQLHAAEKERAENLMIVDLLRNDLGRIARPGSVRVQALFQTQRYDTVWQMTSRVAAETDAEVPAIFGALFPCGSVTGAPKVQTSRIIRRVEPEARGVYCGAIGWWQPGRQACFSVAIRTLTLDRESHEAVYPVGSGVTWDAEAETELRECRQKAAVLQYARPDFELLETLRLDGEYTLLERHLARMRASAEYFGYPFDEDALRDALENRAQGLTGPQRVRLLLARDGAFRIESTPLPDTPQPVFRLALASSPVASSDRFLFHKTTHRAVYDRHRAAFPDADDVILWNERGEITETTIGNLVIEIDGERLTPTRDCGVLAGTFRAELLASGEIREAVVTKPMLHAAQHVWLINSVRGWVEAALDPVTSA